MNSGFYGELETTQFGHCSFYSQVTMQHMKSKKTLDFVANAWLSRIQADGDTVCELPVVQGGQAIFPCVSLPFESIYCMYKCFIAA